MTLLYTWMVCGRKARGVATGPWVEEQFAEALLQVWADFFGLAA